MATRNSSNAIYSFGIYNVERDGKSGIMCQVAMILKNLTRYDLRCKHSLGEPMGILFNVSYSIYIRTMRSDQLRQNKCARKLYELTCQTTTHVLLRRKWWIYIFFTLSFKHNLLPISDIIFFFILNLFQFPVWDSIDKKRSHSTLPFFCFPPNILKYSCVSNFSEKTRRLHKLILLPWFKKKCLTLAKKLKLMFIIN